MAWDSMCGLLSLLSDDEHDPQPQLVQTNQQGPRSEECSTATGSPRNFYKEYLCVYVFIEYDHIITYSIYYIHTYIWIHTRKYTRTHTE